MPGIILRFYFNKKTRLWNLKHLSVLHIISIVMNLLIIHRNCCWWFTEIWFWNKQINAKYLINAAALNRVSTVICHTNGLPPGRTVVSSGNPTSSYYLPYFSGDSELGRCNLPLKTGPCKAAIPRFFYNPRTHECERFTYGGCQGNANNFKTLEDCEVSCAGKQTLVNLLYNFFSVWISSVV